MKVISVIPARGGSKGIHRKNLRLVNNKPLISYSIEQSLKSKIIDETYVSTEDLEIKEISLSYGAKVIDRPKHLAKDTSSTESVLLHASEVVNHKFDFMVILQPTSPIRFSTQIDEAFNTLIKNRGDSLLSVFRNHFFLWSKDCSPINYDFNHRPRRQEKEWEYIENGSIYIISKNTLLEKENRLGGKIVMYEMPYWMSFEIDELFDLELVSFIIKNRLNKKFGSIKRRIEKVKLLVFDVDGVFTDGSVYVDKAGNEILRFSRIDGKGIELIKSLGYITAVITSENSQIVRKRMEKLGIDDIYINIQDKMGILESLKKKYKLKNENICYLGDDIQDLEIVKRIGFSCCPRNAQPIIKRNSDYQSPFSGSDGFVRDICNKFIKFKKNNS